MSWMGEELGWMEEDVTAAVGGREEDVAAAVGGREEEEDVVEDAVNGVGVGKGGDDSSDRQEGSLCSSLLRNFIQDSRKFTLTR